MKKKCACAACHSEAYACVAGWKTWRCSSVNNVDLQIGNSNNELKRDPGPVSTISDRQRMSQSISQYDCQLMTVYKNVSNRLFWQPVQYWVTCFGRARLGTYGMSDNNAAKRPAPGGLCHICNMAHTATTSAGNLVLPVTNTLIQVKAGYLYFSVSFPNAMMSLGEALIIAAPIQSCQQLVGCWRQTTR